MSCQKASDPNNGLETNENEEVALIRTVYGNILIKFYQSEAPNTVKRVKELITQGFYDGQVFHNVLKGSLVQTGDPTGTGSGGSGKKIKNESNQLKHVLGSVSMALSEGSDSADSQFFVALKDLPEFDGTHTIFGQVIEGINHLEKIVKNDKVISISLRKLR